MADIGSIFFQLEADTSQLTNAQAAITNLKNGVSKLTRTNSELGQSYVQLKNRIDPTFRAQQQLKEATRTLNAEFTRGTISSKQYYQDLARVRQQTAGLRTSTARAGSAFGVARGQTAQFGQQIQDVAVQLQGGADAALVFGQQGAQIASIFGPGGAALGAVIAIGSAIGGTLINALTGATEASEDLQESINGLANELEGATEAQAAYIRQQARGDLRQANREINEQERAIAAVSEELDRLREAERIGFDAQEGRFSSENASDFREQISQQQQELIRLRANLSDAEEARSSALSILNEETGETEDNTEAKEENRTELEKLIGSITRQATAIGKTDRQLAILEARQKGATEAQVLWINASFDAIEAEEERQEALKRTKGALEDAAEMYGNLQETASQLMFWSPEAQEKADDAGKESGKTFAEAFEEASGDIGDSIADAIVSGDFEGVGSAIGGSVAKIVSGSLSESISSGLGGAGGALGSAAGPIGGILGSAAGGLIGDAIGGLLGGGEKSVSRRVQISVQDAIVSGFEQVKIKESGLLGSSTKRIREELGLEVTEAIENSFEDATRDIGSNLDTLGVEYERAAEDFAFTLKDTNPSDFVNDAAEQFASEATVVSEVFRKSGETLTDSITRIADNFETATRAFEAVNADIPELVGDTQENISSGIRDTISAIDQQIAELRDERAGTPLPSLESLEETGLTGRQAIGRRRDILKERREINEQLAEFEAKRNEQLNRLSQSQQIASVALRENLIDSIAELTNVSSDEATGRLSQLTQTFNELTKTDTERAKENIADARAELARFDEIGIDAQAPVSQIIEQIKNFGPETEDELASLLVASGFAQDLKESTEDLAQAQKDANAEQREAAEEQARIEQRLNRELDQLQGDTQALRARELEGLNDTNTELQKRIFRLQDEQEIAREKAGLERELLRLQGNTQEIRQRELDELDESNRSIQRRIFRLQDEKEIQDEISKVQNERQNLEREFLQAAGETELLRERELESLDPLNRVIQKRIFEIEDEKNRLDELAETAQERIDSIKEERQELKDSISDAASQTDSAFDVLVSRIEEQKQKEQEALDARLEAIKSERDARLSANESIIQSYGESVSELESVLSTTRDALSGLSEEIVGQEATRQQALAEVQRAIASGNPRGAGDAAQRAAQVTTGPFESRVDFERAQGRTAATLAQLESLTEDQLSDAEQTIKELKAQTRVIEASAKAQIDAAREETQQQLDGLDQVVERAREQIDGLRDIEDEAQSINGALTRLRSEQRSEAQLRKELEQSNFDKQLEKANEQLAEAKRQSEILLGMDITLESIPGAVRDRMDVTGTGGSGGADVPTGTGGGSGGGSSTGTGSDSGGDSFWDNFDRATVADVADAFTGSNRQEWFNRVKGIYEDLLGRHPDAEGMNYWTDQVVSGTIQPNDLRDEIREVAEAQGFANGGTFGGGLRVVGEQGPEMEMTGSSKIMSNSDLMEALGASGEMLEEMRALRGEMLAANRSIAKHTSKSAKQLERWDLTGLPQERSTV